MVRHAWVEDPENWWFIESACDGGYMTEIFTNYYDTAAEYEKELEAIRRNNRWHTLQHRPPLRAGLSRFQRK